MDIEKHYRDWLILTQAHCIGPVSCHKLIEQFGSPSNILESDTLALKQAGIKEKTLASFTSPDQSLVDQCLQWLTHEHHHLVTCLDDDYPELLSQIHDAPPILFAAGNRNALTACPFAIVGSRNPTRSGRSLAEDFATELTRAGLSICSGLALGIDYHSHLGCLEAGGTTLAVIGNGPDIVYPARHRKIAEQIQEQGLLVSEFVPGTRPTAMNFPRRNRIISGLSTGVLVVEAARKSGSLITAQFALEQGRDVFAIPGSIHNPLARGAHALIKQGAKLVESIDDILVELAPVIGAITSHPAAINNETPCEPSLDPEYTFLLEKIGYEETSIDELVKSSGLTAESVSSMLLLLELQGLVEPRQGGKYCRCPQR